METASSSRELLSPRLRAAVYFTALINLGIGLSFLFAPELGFTLWPTAIAPVLLRFIGSIVTANGVGAWLVARRGTWEGARALFAVALVYGAIVLVALLYHLFNGTAAPILWVYALIDALFLIPIGFIYWSYERARPGFNQSPLPFREESLGK